MNNLIILEGCDRTGKTTFAEKLMKEGYEYVHFSAPSTDEDTYKTYMTFLNNIDVDKKYVIDRFHVGEVVYGPIYREKAGLTDDQFRNINLRIAKFDHQLILFDDDKNNIIQRFKACGENYTLEEDVDDILIGFRHYYDLLPLNKDTFTIGKKQIINTKFVKTDQIINSLEGCGFLDAKYIFIGENMNLNIGEDYIRQAFDFGKSSSYLFKLINDVGINLYDVYITNAFKLNNINDNLGDLQYEIDVIKPKYIIFMGQRSQLFNVKLNIYDAKVINIPHPSFLQRFPERITKFNSEIFKELLS